MYSTVLSEIEALRHAPPERLRMKYRELFQEQPRSKHKQQMFRQIAWRMQAVAEGGLSERARRRAGEIANEADLRVLAPRGCIESEASTGLSRYDRRIPSPGTILSREFRGNTISVKVLPDGFEYQGRTYRSLSAIASEVTGTRWNGLAFFRLAGDKKRKVRNGAATR